jgi:hypothetical protein
LNIQPVIPKSISPNWNLITRTILPVAGFTSPAPGVDGEFGLSDTVQSFFFSPKATHNGRELGCGPRVSVAHGDRPCARRRRVGVGPTFVILKQQSGWTYGVLPTTSGPTPMRAAAATEVNATFIQPFLPEVNATFIQPFLAYTWNDSTDAHAQQ